jgi:hypothetical protein
LLVTEVAGCAVDSIQPDDVETRSRAYRAVNDQRVWVQRRHRRLTLCQAHAIVEVDWAEGVARAACGLGLRPEEIDDIPAGGGLPCELCVAETPLWPVEDQ